MLRLLFAAVVFLVAACSGSPPPTSVPLEPPEPALIAAPERAQPPREPTPAPVVEESETVEIGPEISDDPPPPEDPILERRAALEALYATPRHRPAELDGPARPCRIAPGDYACRVSEGYKLRDCVVERLPSGHVMLEVMKGNLLELRGVLYDDGPVVRFEGWPTAARPFKCFHCQERCFLDPSACHCTPAQIERTASCLGQPVHAVLKGRGRTWNGVVIWRDYYDAAVHAGIPPRNVVFEDGLDRFKVLLKLRRKAQSPAARQAGATPPLFDPESPALP